MTATTMAMTPDLAPGARSRMWILLAVTSVMGSLTYWAFGRTEILWVAGSVLAVLVYLLIGVEWTLRRDKQEFAQVVARVREELSEEYLVILDKAGVVMALSDRGAEAFGHPVEILEGQRLYDLVVPASHARFGEALRFGSVSQPWSGTVDVLDEQAVVKSHSLTTLSVKDPEARKLGLVTLGEAQP